jgi:hypothetical protein
VVLWQIPLGNTRMRAMDNSRNHYQDNRVEWLLVDPTRAHLGAYLDAGVLAFLFGPGIATATCACDAAGDGVTDPAPINGNTRPSLSADDDGGFFMARAAEYYRAGAIPLAAEPAGEDPQPDAGPPPLTLSLTANAGLFRPGDTVAVSLVIANAGIAATADVYLGVVLPDGTVVSFVAPELRPVLGVHSMVQAASLAEPFIARAPGFLTYTWTGVEPPGRYTVFVGVIGPPGVSEGLPGVATLDIVFDGS